VIAALRTFYRGENAWDLLRLSRKVLIGSAIAVLVCVVALLVRGLNLGIEFEGGSVWEIPVPEEAQGAQVDDAAAGSGDGVTTDDVASAAAEAGVPDARVQFVVVTGSPDIFRVRGVLGPDADSAAVAGALADAAAVDVESLSSRQVSPSFGDEVAGKARRALVVFFVLIALYLWFRFEWKMSVGALIAVGHDIVLTVGAYALFGFEVTPATVVAFLTIMGYSLYDTIVVFDRIRENLNKKGGRREDPYKLVNRSINETLPRTVLTSGTTLAVLMSLLVLGGGVIRPFTMVLILGVLIGTYSSIFIAAPALLEIQKRYGTGEDKKKQRAARRAAAV